MCNRHALWRQGILLKLDNSHYKSAQRATDFADIVLIITVPDWFHVVAQTALLDTQQGGTARRHKLLQTSMRGNGEKIPICFTVVFLSIG